MSTHAHLGIENPDGSIAYIYCHFDGYPKNMVPMLTLHWATPERVETLIAKGDLQCIKSRLSNCEPFLPKGGPYRTPSAEAFAEIAPALPGSYVYLYRSGAWTMLLAEQWCNPDP